MHVKGKVFLAIFLVIAAAGVTAYDVDFLSKRSPAEAPEREGAAPPEEEVSASPFAVPALPSARAEAEGVSVPPSDAPGGAEGTEGEPFSGGGEGASGKTGPLLGEAWSGSVWERLLERFQASGGAAPGASPAAAPFPSGPDGPEAAAPALRVQGILRCGEGGAVLIDGEVYREGEAIPGTGLEVASVEKGYVVLRSRRGSFRLEKALEPRGTAPGPGEGETSAFPSPGAESEPAGTAGGAEPLPAQRGGGG